MKAIVEDTSELDNDESILIESDDLDDRQGEIEHEITLLKARVKAKMERIQAIVEQSVQLNRLVKRNRKFELKVKRRLSPHSVEASFENQRCMIPFVLC